MSYGFQIFLGKVRPFTSPGRGPSTGSDHCSEAGGVEASTLWLILPLCAPDGLKALLLPAVAAALTCLAGLAGAIAARRGWLWVGAAWLAPWVHQLVFSQIPNEFFC